MKIDRGVVAPPESRRRRLFTIVLNAFIGILAGRELWDIGERLFRELA